ncbi:ComEC/Rec2 family competence protein [Waterburya agarophytonicola K14]|uniref:ComEC/Rec2 family competence protein n=1 Tax=Waterburya agarophytonicola KI4 TaxID=2874699 RepID=A0A964FH40_9CYAN|nr:ComEC/Rec2 family competence protein [Waterburya agarophytonicola]MCC0177254.1 ComEC/Rec2 family competence protein [Waterburya agarophytonicola KI4]
MTPISWIVICLAYIVGLLVTNFLTVTTSGITAEQLLQQIALVSGLVVIIGIVLRKLRISLKVWWAATIVAILAILYFQLRIPQPDTKDVVYQVSKVENEVVTVVGKVISEPRLNASHKIKFWLKATEINHNEPVSGKLYVSLPLLQSTGINLGEEIKLKGILYIPQAATTAGAFDFGKYLARQGIFAGMQGLEVIDHSLDEPRLRWWKLRRRIVRSHLRGLGSPEGQLVSSMVLGRKAVDLPADLRDRFIEAGLAHVLAASGFHVSLLLGLILKLTNRLRAKPRLIIGISTLIVYLGLTGIQASVLRACLMGSAVLVAMTLATKVKPLGSLLLVATLILLFNPLFVGDLGFQLSFLATFGLIVTMPGLQSSLDWLPPTIATSIAVPLAASIWVLPLLCYQFNIVATYSIIVNILCTPLIVVISLGGMISAIAGLILPIAGSAIAWLLLYPTKILITAVNLFTSLPGSSWVIGQISLGILSIIYSLLFFVWLDKKWRNKWRSILLLIISLIIIPIGYKHFNLTQITVIPSQLEPVIVIQDRGKTVLVNSGSANTFKYTVLPFLNHQGINHLNYYFDLNPNFESNSSQIGDRISIEHIISTPQDISEKQQSNNLSIKTNNFKIDCDRSRGILKLEMAEEIWLILGKVKLSAIQIQEYTQENQLSQKSIAIITSSLPSDWLQLNPQTIISSFSPTESTRRNLPKPYFYNLKQNGAIAWTPEKRLHQTQKTLSNSIF